MKSQNLMPARYDCVIG